MDLGTEKIIELLNNREKAEELEPYLSKFNDDRDNCPNLYRYVFPGNRECVIYIPDEVTSSTNISIYYPGGGGKVDWYHTTADGNMGIQDYLMRDGNNQIVIMPSAIKGYQDYEITGIEAIDLIKKEYNLSNANTQWGGWSRNASTSLEGAAAYIKTHPNAKPQVVVTIDGYKPFDGGVDTFVKDPSKLIEDIKDPFIQSGSVMIACDPPVKGGVKQSDYLAKYAEAGINVIKVESNTKPLIEKYSSKEGSIKVSGSHHFTVNQEYFYDGFINFSDGKELPSEGYTYSIWNKETESWQEIDVSEINTYEKIMKLFGNNTNTSQTLSIDLNKTLKDSLSNLKDLTIKTEDEKITTNINLVRGNIKKSNFLHTNLSLGGTSSTTQVPTSIPKVISSYFNSTMEMLEKITNETENFVKVHNSIIGLDDKLKEEAEDVNQTEGTENKDKTEGTENKDKTEGTENKDKTEETENKDNTEETEKKPPVTTQTGSSPQPSQETTPPEDIKLSEEEYNLYKKNCELILDFDSLISDENKIVYECGKNCKIVIHKSQNKILGIEYYYKSNNNINDMYNIITKEYHNLPNINSIIKNDNCVKVNLDINGFKHLDINSLKQKYSKFKQI